MYRVTFNLAIGGAGFLKLATVIILGYLMHGAMIPESPDKWPNGLDIRCLHDTTLVLISTRADDVSFVFQRQVIVHFSTPKIDLVKSLGQSL